MEKYVYNAHAYEERYRKVYEAGADFWEEPVPTEALVKFLNNFGPTKGRKALEMGCGEGRDSIYLAKIGFHVTGMDVSQSAIKHAKKRTKKEMVDIDFLVANVANIPLKDDVFDLAVNVACLQMLVDQGIRDKHLHETFKVLTHGGIYFSCNVGVDESTTIEEFYQKLGKSPGDLIPKRITVQGKEKEIYLPLIAAWPKSRDQYIEEFVKAGFHILKVYREKTKPVGSCWVVIATKHHI